MIMLLRRYKDGENEKRQPTEKEVKEAQPQVQPQAQPNQNMEEFSQEMNPVEDAEQFQEKQSKKK